MDDLKVAAVSMHSHPGDIPRNLERIASFVEAAARRGADMICFPELSVTGYRIIPSKEDFAGRTVTGALEALSRMARDTGMVVMAGLMEPSETGKPYITQVVAIPGKPLGRYRKTHLSPVECAGFRAGTEIGVFRSGNTVFGVALCYEAHFPEISTLLCLKGSEILFIPHASPRGDPETKLASWLRHLTARAFDNGAYVVACNPVDEGEAGLTFPGAAVVLGPDGHVLARYTGNEEKILFASLEDRILREIRAHRMKYFLPHRRPELYKDLVSPAPEK